jgi:hypothetical protein
MSKKKSTTPKTVEPKAKYHLGQKAFTIKYHKGRPEEILEVKIGAVNSKKIGLSNNVGVRVSTATEFSYNALTPFGGLELFYETALYPSFQQAANKFAEGFLYLLK